MTILSGSPDQPPRKTTGDDTLSAIQQMVGSPFQTAYSLEKPVALICHEEDNLLSLPLCLACLKGRYTAGSRCGAPLITEELLQQREDICPPGSPGAEGYLSCQRSPGRRFGNRILQNTKQAQGTAIRINQ